MRKIKKVKEMKKKWKRSKTIGAYIIYEFFLKELLIGFPLQFETFGLQMYED